ncbi:MAG: carboxypeptidase regulatory-like domain-containing protein [Myxococcales bacterium]|nr:carboxypeptidase regulatory-like domain-containing protein [Myxococcales bacterium]
MALALGLLACDDSQGQRRGAGDCPPAGCPEPLQCAAGLCVSDETPTAIYDLRIQPPTDSALSPVEVEGLVFSEGATLSLATALPVPARVAFVGQAVSPAGLPLAARASARPNRGITVRPQVVTSEALTNPGNPGFRLDLAPWWPTPDGGARQINYRLLIEPAGLPPYRVDVLLVDPDLPVARFALPETNPAALPTIRGVVVVSEANPTPLRGLTVVALDSAGRSVGTVATTDESGAFTIALWPDEAPRALTVRVSSDDDARPLPVVRVPVDVPGGGAPEPLTVQMGTLGSLFEIVGRVGDVSRPVSGATVRLSAPVGDGEYAVTTRTDDAGRFAAQVFPGEYVVDVVPPLDPDLPLRLTRRSASLGPNAPPVLVAPLTRSQVFGAVLDPGGEPLGGATVTATLIEARYGDPRLIRPGEAPPSRIVTGVVNPNGAFDLALDPGRHRLLVQPPPERGLPAFSVEVDFSGESGRPADVGTLRAPAAAAIAVRLATEAGAPLAGAAVEAWRRDTVPQRLAHGVTDSQGEVVLAVPASDPTAAADAGP